MYIIEYVPEYGVRQAGERVDGGVALLVGARHAERVQRGHVLEQTTTVSTVRCTTGLLLSTSI